MEDLPESEIIDVNRRAAAFLRTGDPAILWPHVDEQSRLAALAEIEHCIAAVLRGDAARLGENADALGVAGLTSGTGPLLGAWVESGRIAVPASTGAVLARHLAQGRARAERLQSGLCDALDALAARGVSVTLLKGIHTARVYYPDPGARSLGDIDVYVLPEARRAAERALAGAHWRRGERQRRPYKCDWLPPGVDRRVRSFDYVHAMEPWSVEVHASLNRIFAPGRHAQLPVRTGDDEPWTIAGRSVRVLRPPLLVAYLAAHASEETHRERLGRIVELVLVCRLELSSGRLVWSELEALLSASGSGGFVYPALAFAERLAPGTIDAQLLAECAERAGPRVRAFVDAGTAADRSQLERVRLAEKFMWSRGPMDTARRLGRMMWPKTGTIGDMLRTYARRIYRLYHGRITGG